MDYKNLVKRLKQYSAKYQCNRGITEEAADAIETLIKEIEERPYYGKPKKINQYGIGEMLLSMDIYKLKRLYNSGGMPMPLTKEGYYDLETSKKIEDRVRRGY